jgi:hypothetical protein
MKSSFHSSYSGRLASRLFISRLHYFSYFYFVPFSVSFYNSSARRTQEIHFIVKVACLLCHWLAMDVLLFGTFVSAGMCLASRCLAICIHVTLCWHYLCVQFQFLFHSPTCYGYKNIRLLTPNAFLHTLYSAEWHHDYWLTIRKLCRRKSRVLMLQ